MTSEAIDKSGVNVFMFALARGIGRARGRFESKPTDANEPIGIGQIKPGRRTATSAFSGRTLFTIPLRCHQRNARAGRPFAFWPSVCGKHHRPEPRPPIPGAE